jgi:hypothetical protein
VVDELSPQLVSVIEQFAESVGVEARPAPDGSYSFLCSHSGLLTMTASERSDRLIVSLSRKEDARRPTDLERHFLTAGYDAEIRKFLHSCIDDDGAPVCAFAYDERELDLPTLDAAVQRLIEAMD